MWGIGDFGEDIEKGKRGRHGKVPSLGLGFSALPPSRLQAKINY